MVVVDYPVLLSKVTAPICLVGPSPMQLTSAPGVNPVFPAVAAKEFEAINGILRREIETVVGRIRSHTARGGLHRHRLSANQLHERHVT